MGGVPVRGSEQGPRTADTPEKASPPSLGQPQIVVGEGPLLGRLPPGAASGVADSALPVPGAPPSPHLHRGPGIISPCPPEVASSDQLGGPWADPWWKWWHLQPEFRG